MNISKVINLVSGKGGTGKSLLTAVLGRALAREGLHVLIIDLDIFVRGLTILLTESGKRVFQTEGYSISDLLGGNDRNNLPAIERFFECDLIPAVADIGEVFSSYNDHICSLKFNSETIESLLNDVRDKYDVILLDNRSGLDNIILASCKQADIVLSIADDDDISLQTNSNLINHLRFHHNIPKVYTLINKARRIYSYKDLEKSSFRKVDFNYIGIIPFDAEVMEDFGTERFWSTVYETLYFRAVIDSWNNLASREGLKEISLKKYHFPPAIFMSPKSGRQSLFERMLIFYGLVITGVGIFYWLYQRINDLNESDVIAISAIGFGVILIVLGAIGFRRFLVGSKFPIDNDK